MIQDVLYRQSIIKHRVFSLVTTTQPLGYSIQFSTGFLHCWDSHYHTGGASTVILATSDSRYIKEYSMKHNYPHRQALHWVVSLQLGYWHHSTKWQLYHQGNTHCSHHLHELLHLPMRQYVYNLRNITKLVNKTGQCCVKLGCFCEWVIQYWACHILSKILYDTLKKCITARLHWSLDLNESMISADESLQQKMLDQQSKSKLSAWSLE